MKRAVWICEGCKDSKCTFITLAETCERKPVVCPVAMDFVKRCDWRKTGECEIPEYKEVKHD